MGMYQNGPGGESIENLHHKDDRDGAESSASEYQEKERGKILVCITFIIEIVILAGLIVLEYFLRCVISPWLTNYYGIFLVVDERARFFSEKAKIYAFWHLVFFAKGPDHQENALL